MGKRKTQWHSGFIAAMELELWSNRDSLSFNPELVLNKRSLHPDLLIVKKEKTTELSGVWDYFRGHNLMEYKSPCAALNLNVFHKVNAYAHLYVSNTRGIKAEDVTITFVRQTYPMKLVADLKALDYTVVESDKKGVYEIKGGIAFEARLIITNRMDPTAARWLSVLRKNIEKKQFLDIATETEHIHDTYQKENAYAVWEVLRLGNEMQINEWYKEANNMYIIDELVEPKMKEREAKGKNLGMDMINALNNRLILDGRFEDLKRATTDRAFQNQLIKELFPEQDI